MPVIKSSALRLSSKRISYAKLVQKVTENRLFSFCNACRTRSHLQEVRQSEEPRQDAHRNGVRALPAVDGVNALPFLLLDESHERVHVSRAGVAAELAIGHVEDGWQGGDKESAGQARVISKKWRKKTSSHIRHVFPEKILHNIHFCDGDRQVVAPRAEILPDGLEALACGAPGSEARKTEKMHVINAFADGRLGAHKICSALAFD